MRSFLRILPSQCSLLIYHYKKTTSKTYGKKHAAPFKYVDKSVLLTLSPYHREVMQNILFYMDILTRVK